MGELNESVALDLLNYDKKLDIELLDRVVHCMYNGEGTQQKIAEKILTAIKEDLNSWTRVDAILEFSQLDYTKYFALQILEAVIKTRWKVLPRDQCEGIKKYIVGLIIKISLEQDASNETQSVLLNKLNMILVQILKHEWPSKWDSFISDIVGSGRTNENLCRNNLFILKLLSEEVFDFSAGQLTQAKAAHLKDSMCAQFGQIFELCQFVLRNSRTVSLVLSTLETLLRFIHWIPLGYIFETDLISMLVNNFLSVSNFRNTTLKCLTEIAGISESRYNSKFLELFINTTKELMAMIPGNTDLKLAYHNGTDDEQKFIQNLAMFYSILLKEHSPMIESVLASTGGVSGEVSVDINDLEHYVHTALGYLLRISEVEDIEIFKICLEYWVYLASNLFCGPTPHNSPQIDPRSLDGSLLGNLGINDNRLRARRLFYEPFLSRLRQCIIGRMARPEEVLIVENEQKEVVRVFMRDTDAINMYKTMRETLVFLTHLNPTDTQSIMTEKMARIMNGTEWSRKNLNTLCWAIGSISGALNEEEERRFLVVTVRDLLSLCEEKRGKNNKAVVASNIMYVVGQYPRFLRAHWRFLRTVVNKLFEFMHETFEGVQDMACDTFIKISRQCKRQFVTLQMGEARTFIVDILMDLRSIICDLEPQQVQTFYEAVGIIIAAHSEQDHRLKLVEKLYQPANMDFDKIIAQASSNIECLRDAEIVRQLTQIFKINTKGARHLGIAYIQQLGRIYLDMLNVYKVMSSSINLAINSSGEEAMSQPIIRSMRGVKKEVLRIIYFWVQSVSKNQMCLSQFSENFLPPLLEAVLIDYQHNVPAAREPEVLNCMAIFVTELEDLATPSVPAILDAVFQCTLEMINREMAEFPDHRTYFFSLLEAVNAFCFSAFLKLDAPRFKLLLDSIVWAIKHTMRQVSETGLKIIYKMLTNVTEISPEQSLTFYQQFYIEIMSHMFSVITDSSQTGNLTTQCQILAHMFYCLESGIIAGPLNPELSLPVYPSKQSLIEANMQFVHQTVTRLLNQAFPHLLEPQLRLFVDGLFSFDQNPEAFYNHVRDFLVQIREFSGEDLSDLFLEDRQAEMRRANEAKQLLQRSVPGLLPPHAFLAAGGEDEDGLWLTPTRNGAPNQSPAVAAAAAADLLQSTGAVGILGEAPNSMPLS